MTIRHHPSDITLAGFTAGSLDEGREAAVATHLAACPHCRAWVHNIERIGGAMLEGLPPSELAPGALDAVLARLGDPEPAAAIREHAVIDDVPGLPVLMRRYRFGSWRWVGPGVQLRPIELPQSSPTRMFLLRAGPGTRLPDHTHTGVEMTCVLTGSFHDGRDRFGPGDFDETDESVDHRPVVDDDAGCICLVAMQGELRLNGWFGRLLQPFVRI